MREFFLLTLQPNVLLRFSTPLVKVARRSCLKFSLFSGQVNKLQKANGIWCIGHQMQINSFFVKSHQIKTLTKAKLISNKKKNKKYISH